MPREAGNGEVRVCNPCARSAGSSSCIMKMFLLISLILLGSFLSVPCAAAETNSPVTTNAVPSLSDEELQAAARDVMNRIVIFGVIAILGALVVAGFALYGAYRKFGARGVILVAVLLAFGFVALGSLLTLF